jgi:hypothetical protein
MEKNDDKKEEKKDEDKKKAQPPHISDIESDSDDGQKKGKQPVKNLFRKI